MPPDPLNQPLPQDGLPSEAMLQSLLGSVADCLKILDLEGRILWINQAGLKLLEIPDFELVRNQAWVSFLQDTAARTGVERAIAEGRLGRAGQFQGFCPTMTGTPKWWNVVITPITGVHGRPEKLFCVSRDITDARKTEQNLEQARIRLDHTLAAAEIGTWTWNVTTDEVAVDENLARIFNVPEGRGGLDSFLAAIHPEDRDRIRQEINRSLANPGGGLEADYRVMAPDGNARWLIARGKVQLDNNGLPFQFSGAAIDITSRKKQEEAIRELTRKLEDQARLFDATLSSIADLAYTFDRNARVIYANKPMLEIWGRSLDQAVGKNLRELNYPEELAARLNDELRQVITTGKTVRGETVFTSVKGVADYHEYIFNPVFAPDGSVVAVAGTTRLVTQRKKREKILQDQANMTALRAEINARLNQGGTMREVLQFCADVLSGYFGRGMVRIWTLDPNGEVAELQASSEEENPGESHSDLAEGFCFRQIVRSRQPTIISDPSQMPEWPGGAGMSAFSGYPLLLEKQLYGVLTLASKNPFSETELRELPAVVESLTQWIRRRETDDLIKRSAEQLRLAFAAASLGDWQWDPVTDLTTLSDRAAEIFGVKPGILITRTQLRERIAPEFLEEALAASESASMPGGEYNIEYKINHSQGAQRWVAIRGRPLFDETGKLISMLGVIQDITERKKASEANQYLASIVASSDDAILSKNLDGIITSWNAGAQRLFGYEAAEVIGKPVTILLPPGKQDEEPVILEKIRRGLSVDHFETQRIRKDHSLIHVSLTVSPIKDSKGRIIGASKIARNITEQKKTEEKLRQAQAKLQGHADDLERRVEERTAELRDINSQLETLVYSIAHDLRAPLRAMQAYSQTLLEDYASVLDETAQHYARRIVYSAENMDALVLDLLAYGRIARSEMVLAPVDLRKAWEAALEQHEEEIRRQKARVETSGTLSAVLANEATLIQVLSNLLGNALKFMPPGVTPLIRFRGEDRGPVLRIWVEDNGIGIDPEYHERIFRVFERLEGRNYPGTGIGLSIVRKGCERMGGRAGVESTLGNGCAFWVELQKAPASFFA